jgi:hypothetical protein
MFRAIVLWIELRIAIHVLNYLPMRNKNKRLTSSNIQSKVETNNSMMGHPHNENNSPQQQPVHTHSPTANKIVD